ncbi:helix-turn-helix domain-containing GNAT family N-acetyltransferase [Terrisporobacter petrolearius]|uniref:bifunctional helix-turn-helix transcriptional regulator/GNAT family N-acetyltransferase n=1 Tax=Terrisporobacter petrolearius TaxID=1460447 RepID=UPI001D16C77E|nr:helix-turn-helix domain-containing GNAT family N-acetyltransferase [Terrisporobacter petrolearius]MCC3863748.1 helix-turn-helix domain-containing GNAT family N-acetyltransferase [Terrisporobacter petrolearius]
MKKSPLDNKIDQVRKFNRFFTRKIGALHEGLLHSSYSLTEVRILFEIANGDNPTATKLSRELGLDAGYLSRIITRFDEQGLTERVRSEHDGRQFLIRLTQEGMNVFSDLDQRSRDEVAEILNELSEEDQQKFLKSMHDIENILNKKSFKLSETFFLRSHQPGDMGWVTHRHGVLYAQEYGWDEHFEALVAQIAADFINNYKPERERCIIAEMNGEIVGSVFVVQSSETVAKLRLLLVEPKARGFGLGSRLVQESVTFARRAGYEKIVLWTNSVLEGARHIYAKTGFKITEQESHHSFGKELIGETWEMIL